MFHILYPSCYYDYWKSSSCSIWDRRVVLRIVSIFCVFSFIYFFLSDVRYIQDRDSGCCVCVFFLFSRVFWNLENLSVLENTIQNILSIRYFCLQKRPRFSHRTFFFWLKNIVFCFPYSVRHLCSFIHCLWFVFLFVVLCSFIIWICDRDHFDLKCTFSSESKKHVSQQRFSWKLKTFIKHVICLWSRSEKKSEILNVFTIDIQQQQWNHHKNSVIKQISKKTKPIKSDQFVRRKDEISNENQIGLKNKMTATNGHCCEFAYVKIHWSPFIQRWLYFHRWFSSNHISFFV